MFWCKRPCLTCAETIQIVLSYGIPWNQSVTVPTFNVKDSIELMYLFGVCFFSF